VARRSLTSTAGLRLARTRYVFGPAGFSFYLPLIARDTFVTYYLPRIECY
jgi:hypothetical protein